MNKGIDIVTARRGKFSIIKKMIRLMILYRVPSEKIKPMLEEVRRDYLEDVLQDILGRHENIEHYLKQECDIPESISYVLRHLRLRMLKIEKTCSCINLSDISNVTIPFFKNWNCMK